MERPGGFAATRLPRGARLERDDPFDATDEFGIVLHAVEDFYAHSNWVELGFPRDARARMTDLVDLSGAQQGLNRQWDAPGLAGIVRGDILLGHDDGFFPPGYTIDRDGGGTHVPTLLFDGRTVGRLLVTGKGSRDHDCKQYVDLGTVGTFGQPNLEEIFSGFWHSCDAPCVGLNKDGPDESTGEVLHNRARDLATLQISYEWCRLVRAAGVNDRDGLLLTTWVRAPLDPRPAAHHAPSPAAPAPAPWWSRSLASRCATTVTTAPARFSSRRRCTTLRTPSAGSCSQKAAGES